MIEYKRVRTSFVSKTSSRIGLHFGSVNVLIHLLVEAVRLFTSTGLCGTLFFNIIIASKHNNTRKHKREHTLGSSSELPPYTCTPYTLSWAALNTVLGEAVKVSVPREL